MAQGRTRGQKGRAAAPRQHLLRAARAGFVCDIDAERVGIACVRLGAGRARAEDVIDPAVGCMIIACHGAEVRAGDVLAEIHYRDDAHLQHALPLFTQAWTIGDGMPTVRMLRLEEVV